MAEQKKLSDILLNSERDRIAGIWASAKPADDLKPIPPGEYRCRVMEGALFNSKESTPVYKLTLEVREGVHAGRRLWHVFWLSEVRDLACQARDLGNVFGVSSLVPPLAISPSRRHHRRRAR